jgi:serine/threonine protein kinase
MTEAVATTQGRKLDARYTLLDKLGAGGQGEVWRAHDGVRGVDIALKVLNPTVARKEAAWSALEHEYDIASRLDHPSILKVFPPDRSGDIMVLPMELASGGDLRRLRGAGFLEIIPVLLEVAQALEHAHERGVVHRDLKPGNVLFDARGRARLADFGVAETSAVLSDSKSPVPQPSSARDTNRPGLSPFTASPAQLLGEPPTPADDIYGLGALAYELLSGYPPYYPHFDKKRAIEDRVPQLVPTRQVPPLLTALVMRMLAKDPKKRPRTMREIIDELDAALNDTLTFDFEHVSHPGRALPPSATLTASNGSMPMPAIFGSDEPAANMSEGPPKVPEWSSTAGRDRRSVPDRRAMRRDAPAPTAQRREGLAEPPRNDTGPASQAPAPHAHASTAAPASGQAQFTNPTQGPTQTQAPTQTPARTQAPAQAQVPTQAQATTQARAPTQTQAPTDTQAPTYAQIPTQSPTQKRTATPADAPATPAYRSGAEVLASIDAALEKSAAYAAATAANATVPDPSALTQTGSWFHKPTLAASPATASPGDSLGAVPTATELPAQGSGSAARSSSNSAVVQNGVVQKRAPTYFESAGSSFESAASPLGAAAHTQASAKAANQPTEAAPGTTVPAAPLTPHPSLAFSSQSESPSQPESPATMLAATGPAPKAAAPPAPVAAASPAPVAAAPPAPVAAAPPAPMAPTPRAPGATHAEPIHAEPMHAHPAPMRSTAVHPTWNDIPLDGLPRVARLEPIRSRRWPWVMLGILAGGAAAVYFWLPRFNAENLPPDVTALVTPIQSAISNTQTAISNTLSAATAQAPPAPGAPAAGTPPAANSSAQSPLANAAVVPAATAATTTGQATTTASADDRLRVMRKTFDARMTMLESRGAGAWGGRDFAMAKTLAAESVGARDAGNPKMAQDRLVAAARFLDSVESRAPQALTAQIAAGEKALGSGQQEVAGQAFDMARRIDPNDRRATDGQRRTQSLNGILPLLADAQNAEVARDFARAAQDYSQALSLDPGNATARAGQARANAAFGDDSYAKAVGTGFAALGAGRLDEAHEAFVKARALKPNGAEASEGLRRVSAALTARGFASIRQRAAGLEAQERWDEAEQAYADVLSADPTLAFAQEGRARAGSRAELAGRLQQLIERPDRLASPGVRDEARSLLETAQAQSPSGPVLRSQIARLQILLPGFDKPVRLSLVSDNSTRIEISSIGSFGAFSRRDIELRPGKYIVVGTRTGFRDVRREITVAPGQDIQTIRVTCSEPI